MLKIKTSIILFQAIEVAEDGAISQHHFEAQHLLAHMAIAQHLDAAGVGRDHTADLARAARAEINREILAVRCQIFMQRLQHHAGLKLDSG